MILLDTNIISEMMRQEPNQTVACWMDNQKLSDLFLCTITLAEIHYGLNVLPLGKRRHQLETRFSEAVSALFHNRMLVFDESAAHLYGVLMSERRALGQPMHLLDGQIAAIARANTLSLATRNTRDFKHCGLTLVNPFE